MFKATNITKPDQIETELFEIQSFLEQSYPSDNHAACIDRLQELDVKIARSGKLLADAEYRYNEIVGSSIINALKDAMSEKMSTSTLNKYVESMAKDYKQLVTFADRVNRSATHNAQHLTTIISFAKQQMKL